MTSVHPRARPPDHDAADPSRSALFGRLALLAVVIVVVLLREAFLSPPAPPPVAETATPHTPLAASR